MSEAAGSARVKLTTIFNRNSDSTGPSQPSTAGPVWRSFSQGHWGCSAASCSSADPSATVAATEAATDSATVAMSVTDETKIFASSAD